MRPHRPPGSSGTIAGVKTLLKIGVTAASLWVTTLVFDGIRVDSEGMGKVGTLLLVALIFGVVNALIKPILQFMAKASCLFYLTLGLISLVINAALFLLTAFIADQFDVPFVIDGTGLDRFVTALLGALVVAVVSFVLNAVIPDKKQR